MADDISNLISGMDDMTLEELGGSLLSRQAKLNRQREKEARKSQKIQNALAIIGIGQALTKDAFKRRTDELDAIEAFNRPLQDYKSESSRVIANTIEPLQNVNFESQDYLNYKNDPNLNKYFASIGIQNPTEGDYRAGYLKESDQLELFAAQFREPIDKTIQQLWGKNYETLVEDREAYDYLFDSASFDIARHFLKNTATDGSYRPAYENFLDEMVSLYTQDGVVDMDREDVLQRAMGLTQPQLAQLERAYFARKGNQYRKGIFGGLGDIGRKWFGVSGRNGSPNIFETASNVDMYGNRAKADGLFEINVPSLIRQSTKNNIAELKKGNESELPIGPDTNARIAFEADEDFMLLAMGDPASGVPGLVDAGGKGTDGRFYQQFFANKQWREQRESLLANMAIPTYEGKNQTGRNFDWFRRSRKYMNYTKNLSGVEIKDFNEQTGILAKEMRDNPDFARRTFNEIAGTVDGWEANSDEVNAIFDQYYNTDEGILFMAHAMVARNGLYSKGLFPKERYKAPSDIVESFNEDYFEPAFNKNGGILPIVNDNMIYIDRDGFKTKEEYNSLNQTQKAAIYHQTFLGISESDMDNGTKIEMLNTLFETVSHPTAGPTNLATYLQILDNANARDVLFGVDGVDPTEPLSSFMGYTGIGKQNSENIQNTISQINEELGKEYGFVPDVNNPFTIRKPRTSQSQIEDMNAQPIFKTEEFAGTELGGPNYQNILDSQIDRMTEVGIIPANANMDIVEYKLNRLMQTIAYAESKVNPEARNPESGAQSLFQFFDTSAKTAVNRLKRELGSDYDLPEDIEAMIQSGDYNILDANGSPRLSPESQVLLGLSNLIEDRAVDMVTGERLPDGTGSQYMTDYLTSDINSPEEKEAITNLYYNVHHKAVLGKPPGIIEVQKIKLNWTDSYNKYFNPFKREDKPDIPFGMTLGT